jgi:hypothetical protein
VDRISRRGSLALLSVLVAGSVVAVGAPAGAVLAAPPPPAAATAAPVGAEDLSRLRAELDAVTAQGAALAEELLAVAGTQSRLRVAMDRVAEERERAQDALDRRVREAYMAGGTDPMATLSVALAPDSSRLLAEGASGGVRIDEELVAAVDSESVEVRALRDQAEAARADLLVRADAVYAAQDRARELLAQTEAAWREQQRRAADAAARAAADAAVRDLTVRSAELADQSSRVTFAVAPAVTTRGRSAAAAQAPVVAALEEAHRRSPGSPPPGFRPTGQVITGNASWYGPGFVGKPTASGSPYDPERLTAAMTSLPLGTVVRVSRPDGRAVCVLITDRGPYVGDRVLDLSQAAMRELGRFGVGQVRIEVLERG